MYIAEKITVLTDGKHCSPECPFFGGIKAFTPTFLSGYCKIFHQSESDGMSVENGKAIRWHTCTKATKPHEDPKPKPVTTRGTVCVPDWLMGKKGLDGDNWRIGSIIRKTDKAIYFKDYITNTAYWLPKKVIKFDENAPTDEEQEYFHICSCGKIKVKYDKGPNGENENPEGVWECDRCNDYYECGT